MRIDDDRDEQLTPRASGLAGTAGLSTERRQPPTSKDVARAAGVSQSTVSYVMSGKRPISEATRKVVQDAIDALTYEPHAGARTLAGQRSHVIGLVMPLLTGATTGGLMAFTEQIALSARERDHDILMLTSQEGPAGLARVRRRAMCDAALVMEVTRDDARVPIARELEMPIIFIGVPDDHAGLHCIDFDFASGAEMLVDELCDAGATVISVLGWDAKREASGLNYIDRFRSAAQRRADARGAELRWYRGACHAGADRALDEIVEGGERPALIVVEGLEELGLALARRSLQPGRDLDLVALCPDAEAERQPIPLTSVSPQPRDVSRAAMTWLFSLLDGDSGPELRLVRSHLTRRASVRERSQT